MSGCQNTEEDPSLLKDLLRISEDLQKSFEKVSHIFYETQNMINKYWELSYSNQEYLHTKLKKLEIDNQEIKLLANALKDKYNSMCAPSLKKEPFICPVCHGDSTYRENLKIYTGQFCNVCEGKGVIWG